MSTEKDSNFEVALIGETLIGVEGLKEGGDEVIFKTQSGRTFRMFHSQDCCEFVRIMRCSTPYCDAQNGILVESASEKIEEAPSWESATRTTFIVNQGAYPGFFIEWLGESNGYYSESVSFVEVLP